MPPGDELRGLTSLSLPEDKSICSSGPEWLSGTIQSELCPGFLTNQGFRRKASVYWNFPRPKSLSFMVLLNSHDDVLEFVPLLQMGEPVFIYL